MNVRAHADLYAALAGPLTAQTRLARAALISWSSRQGESAEAGSFKARSALLDSIGIDAENSRKHCRL